MQAITAWVWTIAGFNVITSGAVAGVAVNLK